MESGIYPTMKILIIQQKMIGDVLTTSILFEAIKANYPEAELHYVVNSHTFPVVEHNPFIDKFQFVTPEIEKSKLKFITFLKAIRNENYNVTIDVYGKLGSALMTWISGAETRSGYFKKHTAFIYNHAIVRLKNPQHESSLAIENRMRLLTCLNIPFKPYRPKIYLTELEKENAKNYLKTSGINLKKPLFMISVLGSSMTKTYPNGYMAQLLNHIVKINPDSQLLFNYIPKQKDAAKGIYDLCTPESQQHILFEVFGKSLREFLAITSHCNALIGNEGGANNMAKALNIPTFAIFSPYLNKRNWFGDLENNQNVAVHLSDYIEYDIKAAKEQPALYYFKFKPSYFTTKLTTFLQQL